MKPPRLTTDRLHLRAPRPDDRSSVFDYAKDPEVSRYLPWSAHRSLKDTDEYFRMLENELADGHITWIVETRSQHRVIGTFTLRPHHRARGEATIGFAFGKAHWGQGFVTEAGTAVIAHAHGLPDHHRVSASVWPANHGSKKLLARLGFRHTGQEHRQNGGAGDAVVDVYSLDLRALTGASSPGSP